MRSDLVRAPDDRLDVLDLARLEQDVADRDEQRALVDRVDDGARRPRTRRPRARAAPGRGSAPTGNSPARRRPGCAPGRSGRSTRARPPRRSSTFWCITVVPGGAPTIRPTWSPTVIGIVHQPSPQARIPRSLHMRAYSASRSSAPPASRASEWLIRYVVCSRIGKAERYSRRSDIGRKPTERSGTRGLGPDEVVSRRGPSDATATLAPCRATSVRPWRTLATEPVFEHRWSRLRRDTVELPDGTVLDDYFVSGRPEIAVTLALTPADEVVIARQYKHGIGEITLELPGGLVDEDEEPTRCGRAGAPRGDGLRLRRARTPRAPDPRSGERQRRASTAFSAVARDSCPSSDSTRASRSASS